MFLIKKLGILIVAFSLEACAEKKIEPEIYLVPEGYVGSFYVVYDVRSGLEPEYEDGARLFKFSNHGIIHTQFSLNHGVSYPGMIRFFYVSNDGHRTEITDIHGAAIEDSEKNRNDKRLYIISRGFGEFGFNEETTARGCKYVDRSFYVGALSNILEDEGHFELEDYYRKYGYPCNGKLFKI